jgi:hypothetical protein
MGCKKLSTIKVHPPFVDTCFRNLLQREFQYFSLEERNM